MLRSILFAGLLFATTSADSQEIASSLRPFTIPYPTDGLALGQGWDSILSQGVNAQCLIFAEDPIERSTFDLDVREVHDSYAYRRAKSISVSGGGSGFGVSVSASYARSTDVEINTDFLNYLLTYRMDFGGTRVAPPAQVWQFRENEQRQGGSIVDFSPRAQETLTSGRDNINVTLSIEKFRGLCGDYFVSAIHRGARIDVLATYASANRTEQEAVRASVSTRGWGASISTETADNTTEGFNATKFRFKVDQEGGASPVVVTKFEDVASAIEPLDVMLNPVAYGVTLTPYSALPGWVKLKNNGAGERLAQYSPQSLADVDLMYSTYLDLFRLLDRIEQSYRRSDLALYGLVEALPAGLKEYPESVTCVSRDMSCSELCEYRGNISHTFPSHSVATPNGCACSDFRPECCPLGLIEVTTPSTCSPQA
ncbi:hypothetical protein SAMN04488004_107205 [Loktanella salsilacus]|uniref:MACPF domain-containing protein n=1 Tax=Loktanella salsilacus TaxID=195913 RepID=A0A1I4EWM8_9RHOB|nr:hypothetical protein [Loktanella salsilacus]SFL09520.1 hypothetical protein SAMN04488004_107205 [Loktanella salsilacus]